MSEGWRKMFAETTRIAHANGMEVSIASLKADLAEAASAAHLYGKPLVAAESMTVAAANDMWAFSPAMLKPVADEIFALGVNRILVHDSHHQPLVNGKPGLALFFFGQFFNRNDTWTEQAGPWVDCLTRTSYLLQQGRFVADVGIAPDVTFAKAAPDANLLSLHRRTDDADLYFISNQKDRAESVEASFRVAGKAAQFWNPQTGAITPLAYRSEGDRTVTPLELGPYDSGFVVLRGAADPKGGVATASVRRPLATLEKPWQVTFEPGRGGPTEARTFTSLSDWTRSDDPPA